VLRLRGLGCLGAGEMGAKGRNCIDLDDSPLYGAIGGQDGLGLL